MSLSQTHGLPIAMRNVGASIFYQDRDLRILWAENVPPSLGAHDAVGLSDQHLFPQPEALRVIEAKRAAMRTMAPTQLEIACDLPTARKSYHMWVDPEPGEDGRPTGIFTTLLETTEQRRREETTHALLREVSHRSKNLLAVIQSIATQTGRHADTIEAFLVRFRGRLQALASSQDLVTSADWEGASLGEVIRQQFLRCGADPKTHLKLDVPDITVKPNAALHVGLAMHELVANSLAYGSLSRPGGTVAISASLHRGPAAADVEIVWSEATGAPVEPLMKRFGSIALERVVPASVGGTATLVHGDEALVYCLLMPPSNLAGPT